MVTLQDVNTKALLVFKSVRALLRWFNADRSAEWSAYTRHDWREGIENLSEYVVHNVKPGTPKKKGE